MTLELTDIDFQDLVAKAEQQGELIYHPTEFGIQYRVPKQLGEGYTSIFELRNGLIIEILTVRLRQSIRFIRQHESRFPLVAKFYVSGASRIRTPNVSDINNDYQELANRHYLYHLPNQTEIEEWLADDPIHVVMLSVDTLYFSSFNLGNTTLSNPLQKLLKGDGTQRFHQPLGHMSPQIKQLVQQIVQCPYTGLMQQLYLESKALELLASQFSIWTEAQPTGAAISLCAQDIEQLHHAKTILVQRAQTPPSLTELARLVGLNDRKLKQGFRQLFGTTVFGYLHNYRMEQAQHLLHHPHITISQVATQVGYRNPEAFSTAFRRKFAVSPKTYQLAQRK